MDERLPILYGKGAVLGTDLPDGRVVVVGAMMAEKKQEQIHLGLGGMM